MAYIGNIPAEKYVSLQVQHFTVSATTGYSLDNSVTNENEIALFINNVRQQPGSSYSYTASGTTLTLSAATAATDTMYCVFLGRSVGTINPPAGSVGTSTLATGAVTADKIADGTVVASEIASDAITTNKIADDAVTTAKILDANITDAKISAVATTKLTGTVTNAQVADLDATKLTGSIADARVPASAVTQHVTGYDDSTIKADILKLAISQAVDGNRSAFNLSESFIDGFEDDTGITTETNVDRDTSGEYVASVISSSSSATIASGDWSGGTGGFTLTTGGADQTSSNYGIYTDKTFTGDFTYQADNSWSGNSTGMVGIFDNSEVGSFSSTSADRGGLENMTVSYWADSWYPGSNGNQAYYGGSTQGSTYTTVTNGGTVKFERVGTTIKLYIDGTLRHTYSQTSSATFRGAISGQDASTNMQNIKWTDTQVTLNNATGTLISDPQTASSSRSTCSGVIVYEDAAGTNTLGTDLKIYFSANNGSNWTEASSYGTATTYSGTKKLVVLGNTSVTAGTQIKLKAEWANQANATKVARLHGWAVNY